MGRVHPAFAHEGETLGELHPLGNATDLFAEDAFGASRSQVSFLRRQPQATLLLDTDSAALL